jgi:hypothetical protein
MSKFMHQYCLHVNLSRLSVPRNKIPGRQVTAPLAMGNNFQFVILTKRRSYSFRISMTFIHVDHQFANVWICLTSIAPKLESQVNSRDVHPTCIRISYSSNERPQKSEGIPQSKNDTQLSIILGPNPSSYIF